jgi:hypothetical protein
MINLAGYRQNMSAEEQMRLAVLLGHEAYRNGIVTGDNDLETREAALEHTGMALRMLFDGQQLAFDDNLIRDIVAYMGGADFFNAYVDNNYDSSSDFWKLMRDGTLVNNNTGWLTDEDGNPVLNENGEQIGAEGIETGLLNIIFGGTHNVGYDEYNDEQIRFVQNLMISARMNYHSEVNGDIRTRYWTANAAGQSLNIQYNIPTQAETTPPAVTSNVNTGSRWNQFVSWTKDIARPIYNGARNFVSSASDWLTNGVNTARNWLSSIRSRPQGNNQIEPNNKNESGNYVTIPENFFSNIMNDDIRRKYSYEKTGNYNCNEYFRDMVLNELRSEIYNAIFEGKYEDTNTMFVSFQNNPNLERLDPFTLENGMQDIWNLAENGTFILMIYQNFALKANGERQAGHIAFIGNSSLTLSTYTPIPGLENTRRTRMINEELIVLQAGTKTGITIIRYGTNGWGDSPADRKDLLENDLYFYAVSRSYQ